jgi:hypothetical protein
MNERQRRKIAKILVGDLDYIREITHRDSEPTLSDPGDIEVWWHVYESRWSIEGQGSTAKRARKAMLSRTFRRFFGETRRDEEKSS